MTAHGAAAAGWRLATRLALVAHATACLVWLRDYLVSGIVPLLPVLGAASAVTFVVAAVGYPLGLAAWLGGFARAARVLGTVAATGWLLTAVVFQLVLDASTWTASGAVVTETVLLAWVLVGILGLAALWTLPPRAPVAVGGAALLVLAVGVGVLSSGAPRPGEQGGYVVATRWWLPGPFDRGADEVTTALLVGLVLLLVAGAVLALARVDVRPLVAGVWLAPLLVTPLLARLGPLGVVLTGVLVVLLVAAGARTSRGHGHTVAGGAPA